MIRVNGPQHPTVSQVQNLLDSAARRGTENQGPVCPGSAPVETTIREQRRIH